jgi:integral membrane protein (TIGR01906 family)
MRIMSKLLRALIVLVLIYCLLVYLISAVAGKATNTQVMEQKLSRFADTQVTGLEISQYPPLAQAITGFLKGSIDSPQLMVTRGNVQAPAFSEDEIKHLTDIRGLLQTVQFLRYAAIALLGIALLAYFVLRKAKPALFQAVQPERTLVKGLLIFLGMILALVIWGMIDFYGLFTAAHHVIFRNELWMLDPQRDLLLQLMPLGFFISYGLDLLKDNAFLLLILPLAAFGLRGMAKRGGA